MDMQVQGARLAIRNSKQANTRSVRRKRLALLTIKVIFSFVNKTFPVYMYSTTTFNSSMSEKQCDRSMHAEQLSANCPENIDLK